MHYYDIQHIYVIILYICYDIRTLIQNKKTAQGKEARTIEASQKAIAAVRDNHTSIYCILLYRYVLCVYLMFSGYFVPYICMVIRIINLYLCALLIICFRCMLYIIYLTCICRLRNMFKYAYCVLTLYIVHYTL